MAIIPKMILCLPSLISKHSLSPFNTRKSEKIAVQEPPGASLTLSVDQTESSPPFPSPGSAFLPPPTLSAHEFATRRTSAERTSPTKRKPQEEMNGVNGKAAVDGSSTPTATPSPVTPTPTTFSPPTQVTIPDPQDATLVTPVEKLPDASSLSSSRPAPPSPAVSRRASSAISRPSSRARSQPQSRVTSLSQQQVFQIEHQAEGSSSTVVPMKRPPIKIRDFAYPPSDDRHVGRGPDAPRLNRPRNRSSAYSSSGSSACSDESGDDEEQQQQQNSFSSFRWNTLSTHFWNGQDGDDDSDAGPSQTDLAMNFDNSSPVDEQEDDDEYYTPPSEEEPLIPGTYRALYPFEPEGTAEMALEEEQLVHVIGRGGGVGWAIVEREGGGHALVPESYLELVTPDAR